MNIALELLNILIVSGYEFPDACYRVAVEQNVQYDALVDAYDAQFN